MNRSWMKTSRLSIDCENGLKQFIDLAKKNLPNNNEIFLCPCKNYFNTKNVIFNHLGCDGIIQNYTKWVWRGELTKQTRVIYS